MSRWRWYWCGVPLLGLVELVTHEYIHHRTPEVDDYAALEDAVAQLWSAGKPRDGLILVSPPWAEPNVRHALGDQWMPLRDVARPDLAGYRQVLEIALLDHDSQLPGWDETQSRSMQHFELRLLTNPQHEPVALDFVDSFSEKRAEVYTRRRGQLQPCRYNPRAKVSNGALAGHPTFPRQRFECSHRDWHFVGVTVIEDHEYRPRRCLWAHPIRNTPTVVRFPGVLLGDALHGHGGMPYLHARDGKGAPIDLEVRIGDEAIGQYTHRPGAGWQPFEFDTRRFSGQTQDVEFEVRSQQTHRRQFCFQADVR